MGVMEWQGKAYKFGDDINTDYIISSRRKRDTLDPCALRRYIMEDIRPAFYSELSSAPSPILVAGRNFGCGSAMEIAAQILKASGIFVVIAASFARSYYRNAVNNGILPLETDTGKISEGDFLKVRYTEKNIDIVNTTTGLETAIPGINGIVRDIFASGGIVAYFKNKTN